MLAKEINEKAQLYGILGVESQARAQGGYLGVEQVCC